MKELRALIKALGKDKQILGAFLFGSRVRNDYVKASDIDVCLVLYHGSYTLLELSQKKLEYLNLFNLDIQIFQQLPLYIQIRVIREGKIIYCRNEDSLYELVFCTIERFSDFKDVYENYLKEVEVGR